MGRNSEIQPRFRPFRRVFAFFASRGRLAFGHPDSPQNASKTARPGLTESKILLGHGHWPSNLVHGIYRFIN